MFFLENEGSLENEMCSWPQRTSPLGQSIENHLPGPGAVERFPDCTNSHQARPVTEHGLQGRTAELGPCLGYLVPVHVLEPEHLPKFGAILTQEGCRAMESWSLGWWAPKPLNERDGERGEGVYGKAAGRGWHAGVWWNVRAGDLGRPGVGVCWGAGVGVRVSSDSQISLLPPGEGKLLIRSEARKKSPVLPL